jgi:hypothetical protein
MPCHPHTVPQRLRPFIRTPTSVANLDNPRQRRTNPYGYPEYLRRPFDESRGPSRTFEDLRGPSRSFDPLRSPSRSFEILRDASIPRRSPSRPFDPSSIPFGGLRAYIAPSLRPRTIPQYLGHRPLSRRFPLPGFRTLFGSSVMLVGAVSGIGCIGMQGEPHSSALTVTAPIFGLVTFGSLDK